MIIRRWQHRGNAPLMEMKCALFLSSLVNTLAAFIFLLIWCTDIILQVTDLQIALYCIVICRSPLIVVNLDRYTYNLLPLKNVTGLPGGIYRCLLCRLSKICWRRNMPSTYISVVHIYTSEELYAFYFLLLQNPVDGAILENYEPRYGSRCNQEEFLRIFRVQNPLVLPLHSVSDSQRSDLGFTRK